jgi:hypothetical protein
MTCRWCGVDLTAARHRLTVEAEARLQEASYRQNEARRDDAGLEGKNR